jgi:hypothetical protein
MVRLTIKDWVCLINETELAAKKAAWYKKLKDQGDFPSAMLDCLWRQITLTAKPDSITLELMNVDEEAATGGYLRGGEGFWKKEFTWDDLHDTEFWFDLLKREQVVVYNKVTSMLSELRNQQVSIRAALEAF